MLVSFLIMLQALLVLALVYIPGTALAVNNTSGNCTVEEKYSNGERNEDNGARPSYHAPGVDDSYLPNCKNPLKRELWRIFVKEGDGTAYMIPRPDNVFDILIHDNARMDICNFAFDDEIGDIARLYGLCHDNDTDSSGNALDPNVLNSMAPAHALEFSTIFHRQLQFDVDTVLGDYSSIVPWVPDEDILLACVSLGEGISSDLKSFCDKVEKRCDENGICTEQDVFASAKKNTLQELSSALNDVYGVGVVGQTCNQDEWGATFPCAVAGCVKPPSGCTYKVAYEITGSSDCCEKLCYFVDDDGEECISSSAASSRGTALGQGVIASTSLILSFLLVMIIGVD